MTSALVIAALACLVIGLAIHPLAAATASGSGPEDSPFPLQLEMRVPFAPTAFPSTGRTYLVYELYLTNFSNAPVALRQIDVLDADKSAAQPVASFAGGTLDSMLQPIGQVGSAPGKNPLTLGAGATDIAFMWIALAPGAHMPDRLRHRLLTS